MRSALPWALRIVASLILILFVVIPHPLVAQAATAAQCIDCHSKVTPNIVSDWKLSKHSGVEVSCVTCHGDQHSSASDVAKVKIPTPETCTQCHETQVTQFRKGKHAMAWASMKAMPTIHWQPMAMTQGEKGCGGCHKIGDKTLTEVIELRGNGSGTEFGAAQCEACHTRHTFSAEEARQPRPAKPATWGLTMRSGRCIRRRSTASGMI
jgi:hydroxylamine dehydrogenase